MASSISPLAIAFAAFRARFASEFLRRAGHEVMSAGGGREALEILGGEAGGKIAAVVLDLSPREPTAVDVALQTDILEWQQKVAASAERRNSAGASSEDDESLETDVRSPPPDAEKQSAPTRVILLVVVVLMALAAVLIGRGV